MSKILDIQSHIFWSPNYIGDSFCFHTMEVRRANICISKPLIRTYYEGTYFWAVKEDLISVWCYGEVESNMIEEAYTAYLLEKGLLGE